VLTTCQPRTVWCIRERLPAAAAQPAKVRQSCSATDFYGRGQRAMLVFATWRIYPMLFLNKEVSLPLGKPVLLNCTHTESYNVNNFVRHVPYSHSIAII
jgi:hypothetical protein